MTKTENFAQVVVASVAELENWLARNHAQPASVWLVTFKKQAAHKYLSRDEVLDALLCYGWIDGIRRKLDDARTMQLISPRKEQRWAKTYQDRAARLIAEGRMQPSGEAAMTRAKQAGLWDQSADVDALVIPPDLSAALQANPLADSYFRACPPSYRRNVLRWISIAKRSETRAKRITQTVATSAAQTRIAQL